MKKESMKTVIDYLDSRIKELEKELEALKLLKQLAEREAEKPSVEPSPKELAAILSEAKWRRYSSGRGEWCFADNLPEKFVEELKGGAKTIESHVYSYKVLSGGKEIVVRRPIH